MNLSGRALAISVLAAALIPLGACSSSDSEQFSVSLGKKLRAERPAEIDLAEVSAIPWDEIFIFGPRSVREDNCKVLQMDLFSCRTTFPAVVGEGDNVLVFRRNGKVMRAEVHPRSNGDFSSSSGSPMPVPIKRSAARFTVMPMPASVAQDAPGFHLEYKG